MNKVVCSQAREVGPYGEKLDAAHGRRQGREGGSRCGGTAVLPFWTLDAMTQSAYEGRRGDHYYVEGGSGNNERRERRARWTWANGSFSRFFDDVVVCAAKSAAKALIKARAMQR